MYHDSTVGPGHSSPFITANSIQIKLLEEITPLVWSEGKNVPLVRHHKSMLPTSKSGVYCPAQPLRVATDDSWWLCRTYVCLIQPETDSGELIKEQSREVLWFIIVSQRSKGHELKEGGGIMRICILCSSIKRKVDFKANTVRNIGSLLIMLSKQQNRGFAHNYTQTPPTGGRHNSLLWFKILYALWYTHLFTSRLKRNQQLQKQMSACCRLL